MDIFIIEDDDYKKDKIIDCVLETHGNAKFSEAKSVSKALTSLEGLSEKTIIFLDMSLPTYDLDKANSGGRAQGFGGIEILRNIEFFGLSNKVIVITQYESIPFNDRILDVETLAEELRAEFPDNFFSLIQFDLITDNWKNMLLSDLTRIMND